MASLSNEQLAALYPDRPGREVRTERPLVNRGMNTALHGAGSAVDNRAQATPKLRKPQYNEHGAMHRSDQQSSPDFRAPSPRSEEWLRDILTKRQLPATTNSLGEEVSGDRRAAVALAMLDQGTMSQRQVSKAIDAFKDCPRKAPQTKREAVELLKVVDGPAPEPVAYPTKEQLPAGRYAVESKEGNLTFYRIYRGTRNPAWIEIHVQYGPNEMHVPYNPAAYARILWSIVEAGPLEAAKRYGREIGACSVCGIRLTNKLSRELAIGPVCGGRFHEDTPEVWKAAKKEARDAIRARGEDPNGSVA